MSECFGFVTGTRDLANLRPVGRAIEVWGICLELDPNGFHVQATTLPVDYLRSHQDALDPQAPHRHLVALTGLT